MNDEHSNRELDVITSKLQRSWGWLLALGILFVVLGVLGIGMASGITLFSMYFFAVILFVAGFSQLADAWYSREWKGVVWHLFIALLYMMAAALISYDPLLASTFLTAFLAWIFIFMGISRLFLLFNLYQAPGWWIFLLSAVSAIVLGVIILVKWPMSGVWFIGLMIAIELIVCGWTYIYIALSLHKTKEGA